MSIATHLNNKLSLRTQYAIYRNTERSKCGTSIVTSLQIFAFLNFGRTQNITEAASTIWPGINVNYSDIKQCLSLCLLLLLLLLSHNSKRHSDTHASHKNQIIIVIISVYIQGHKKRFRLKNIFAKQSALLVCSGFTPSHVQLQQWLQPSSKVSVSTTLIRYISTCFNHLSFLRSSYLVCRSRWIG